MDNKIERFIFKVIQIIFLSLAIVGVALFVKNSSKQESEINVMQVNETQDSRTGGIPLDIALNPTAVIDEDHIRGDVNAPITIVEYSDFECQFCKRFHPIMRQLMDTYGQEGKVKWVYRQFPLEKHDPLATTEAMATECVNELLGNDAFWQMSDMIFENTKSNGNGLAVSKLYDFAEEIGADRAQFDTCLKSEKYKGHIVADITTGMLLGVVATPTSFIVDESGNSQLLSGAVPYSQLTAVIDALLK